MTLRYRNDTGAQLFHHIHRFANPCQRIERVASETNLTWYSQRNPAKPSDSLTWLTNLTNCLVSRFADGLRTVYIARPLWPFLASFPLHATTILPPTFPQFAP